jgi:excinuclease ABC subunit C
VAKSSQKLAEQRRDLPDAPGVYVFRDRAGDALYVGKANSIRKRVASHFSGKGGRGAGLGGTAELIDRTESIEFLVTENEPEALLAEQQFIKRYRPRFNIRLRDDKSYPYVGVSLDEEFPRVYFTRERHRPNRAYFGPFSSAKRVRETLDLLGKLFQYRTCEGPEPGRRSGVPCLDYYIKRCQAPCVGYIDREEYGRNIDRIIGFLSGRYKEIADDLAEKMQEASEAQDFERAALFRDRLNSVRGMMERRAVAGGSLGSADIIGVAVEANDANAQVFQVRDGVLAERQGFYLAGEDGEGGEVDRDAGDVAETFLLQYYGAAPAVPGRVIVGQELKGRTGVLAEALSSQRDAQVEVRVASRGDLRRLRELAEKNARLALAQDKLRREHRRQQRVETLSALQEALGLERVPVRIEGFDISNLGETHTVASMVVFEGGTPKKSDYRRFNIRGERGGNGGGPDDVAAMQEVLTRRLGQYLQQADLSPHDSDRDQSFASLPDLIVIDGGKGQLSAGLKALEEFTERGVMVISLAKRIEEVFVPGRSEPLLLERRSDALRILQRVRDEAHRFAITHHRGRRDKAMTASVLDGVRGVGPARKRALLRHFGSPERLLTASREELEAVPGVPGKLAREIHRQLHRAG